MTMEAFMIRAVLTACILGPLCGMLGVFVTARRMSFFSDTIAHASLAGVALGFWWGFQEPTLPMIAFSLVVAAGMVWLKEHTELLSDTIMALLLSGSVALGILVLSLLKGFRGELHRYLFGDITSVSWIDVWAALALFGAVAVWLFSQLSALTLLTAQEEIAHVCGVPVRWVNYCFILVLTLTVALSIRLLGIVLVTSLLVIPSATARSLSSTLRQHLWLSMVVGWLGAVGGTVLAYPLDTPCGPTIVLSCIVLFLGAVAFRKFRERVLHRVTPT
jgi:zinc transport system permease protein